jgi:hypothetical protein
MLKRFTALAYCATVLAVLPAMADQWDKKTTVTFSTPVEMPTVVLPAGTYVFKLLNSSSNRNIVLVYNEAEDHLYTMILAIPNYRLRPGEQTILTFEERAKGAPEALRAWFYPGDNFGQEFVYPKAKAVEFAETAEAPVLAARIEPEEKPEELVNEPVVAVTPEKEEAAITPTPETREEVAEQETPPAPFAALEPAPALELPKTASPLPLLILAGMGLLGLAGALRVFAGGRA